MTALAVGMAVGALAMRTLDGRPITMSNYAERRGTVVRFLSSRSPSFRTALPAILRVYEKHRRPTRCSTVGLCANPHETASELKAFCQRHHVNFPVYRDPGGAIAKRFSARVTPEAFVIDAKGIFRYPRRIPGRNRGRQDARDRRGSACQPADHGGGNHPLLGRQSTRWA